MKWIRAFWKSTIASAVAFYPVIVVLGIFVDATRLFAIDSPNVIVILSDDQGWGDLSINGNTNLSTPNIDSLGRDGARFDRFYVCPVCSPTRAEFLTGRYHPRSGVTSTSTGGERLDLDERTIAQVFKAAGYRTSAFGKWHNGTQFPYHPLARGFDEYYGFTSGHWGDYYSPPLDDNGRPVVGNGFLPDDLTDHAIRFVEHNRERPFFLYLPFNTPHSPMQVPDRWWDSFRSRPLSLRGGANEKLDFTRAALAMVENIDWNVGRLLTKLNELKLAENTIVIYFCDNGPNSDRWNGGMKGRKGSTDEGGVRSPLLVRWPSRIAPGRLVTQIAGAIDLLPTLADLAGVPITGGQVLDGRSVRGLLVGEVGALPERTHFSTWNGKVSARSQQFRLDDRGQLFDMTSDPGQKRDVSEKFPSIAEEMKKQVDQWRNDLLAQNRPDNRPFPIGHPEFHITQLPARDGRPGGKVQRSAKAPNCSYFTNWTNVDDFIYWDVDVLSSGNYSVDIYYACPKKDLGAQFELSFGEHRLPETVPSTVPGKVLPGSVLTAMVTLENDPPARGNENDRVPRESESLVKEFKPMTLGTIHLAQGRGKLTLKATNVPGDQVMEVRGMILRRLE